MNHFCKKLLTAGIAFAAVSMSFGATVKNGADDPAVTKADRDVFAALTKGDHSAANRWLDADFN